MKNYFKRILFLTIFCVMSILSFAQDAIVTGIITDGSTKEPLIGVNVKIKDSNIGVITDIDGKFSIQVPDSKCILVLSYIGYKTKEVTTVGKQPLKILLESDDVAIEEVVVVAYGVQKKESVVGAISSINNKTLVSAPATNITQSLAGKLPGVQIVQPSGEVGRDEASIYIRGMATYGDVSPLIVVDGIVRSSFAQIDPNEVLSINILKDASATAVYGIKGANGVIVVTTRRGNEGKPQISISGQVAITQPTRIPDPLNAYQASVLYNQAMLGHLKESSYKAMDIIKYRTGASPYTHPDEDLTDRIMKDCSTQQQYNVNISGGTKFIKYFVSTGMMMQNGFFNFDDITKFDRYNFRSNLDVQFTKDLSAQINIGARIEQRNNPQGCMWNSWNVYHDAFGGSGRTYPFYNPDGSLSPASNIQGILSRSGIAKNTKSVLESGITFRYDLHRLVEGLSLRAQLSYDNDGENTRVWKKTYATYEYNFDRDKYTQIGEDGLLNWAWDGSTASQKLYYEGGLEFVREFGKHNVTGLLLGNRNLRLINTDFEYAEQGLVARATYSYNRRYFFESNLGINGSENFPKEGRYGVFPAFAAGWTPSNEAFYQDLEISKVLSMFKIRASLGWVGNDKCRDEQGNDIRFIYLQKYNYLNYNGGGGAIFGDGDNEIPGIRKDKIANADVSWEVARKANIGFETDFYNGLFGLNLDVFFENRSKILTDISAIIPGYVGTEFMPANVGQVNNKGFEIEMRHNYKIGQHFTYFIRGNFSFNRNKVIKKADPAGLLPYQKEEGYPIGTMLMYKNIGYFQDYDDIYNSPSQLTLQDNTEVLPGDLKYLDFNKDGIIDEADAFRQGYGVVPEIQYGITIGGKYRDIDFSFLIQGSEHANFSKNWELIWPFSNNENVFARHWYWWSPELGNSIQHSRFHGRNYRNNEPVYASTYTAGSGDYIRLKNVEIGYTFPQSLTRRLGMSTSRIYFTANNLFTWADEKYIDPDNRNNRGGYMPQTRAFNIGLNINF